MIFVSLASFRDPELLQTIQSCFDNADNPQDIVVGVYSQVAEGEHPDLSGYNVREVVVPHTEAKGAGFARAEVQKLYDGEEWFMQVDSHTLFTPHWDTKLIAWQDEIFYDRPLITGWAAPYCYVDGEIVYDRHEDHAWEWVPHTTVARSFRNTWIGGRVPLDKRYAQSQVLLAGFIFVKGSWVRDCPYDPRIAFWGEEFLMSVRSHVAGYEMYSINEPIIYHNYVRHGTVRAWDDIADWDDRVKEAIKIQRDIICLRDESPYKIPNKHIPFLFDYMNLIEKKDLAFRAERMYQSLK